MKLVMAITVVVACAGCGIQNPMDPMQTWAAEHAHETCVIRDGKVTLVPIGGERPGDRTMVMSFCNPAE